MVGFERWLSRIRAAYAAAERLVREAQARGRGGRARPATVPPRGWSVPGDERQPPAFPDLVGAARRCSSRCAASLPPELARQLAEALRELLLALRACSTGRSRGSSATPEPPREVEDIPIE